MNVLLAYATRNGPAQEVASTIAASLRGHGAQVALVPARAVRESLAGYDLVVLGAPLYSRRWHHARGFLRRHRRELCGAAAAVFGMGPRSDTEGAWRRSRAELDRVLVKRAWLDPVAVTVFGGAGPPGRGKGPRRDLRNWDIIQARAAKALAASARIPRQQNPGPER